MFVFDDVRRIEEARLGQARERAAVAPGPDYRLAETRLVKALPDLARAA